jgi:flagellar motor switch protein FliN/FliY
MSDEETKEESVTQAEDGGVEASVLETTELPSNDASDVKPNKDLNLNMILDIPVHVHVELGSTEASIRNILNMGPGSIVELEREAGESADLMVNGKLIGKGDVVVVGDNFGIRITSLVDPEQRLESL